MSPASWQPWLAGVTRFAALAAFAFWQGGFVVYAAVVVPIGSDELGDTVQGFVTRRVTQGLNLAGFTALLLWLADRLVVGRPGWCWWVLWGLMVIGQVALAVMHPVLDSMLEPATISILNREAFRPLHRVYLWTSSVLWALSLVWLWLIASGELAKNPVTDPLGVAQSSRRPGQD